MTDEEEKELDKEIHKGVRDIMDTLWYIQHELKDPLTGEERKAVRELLEMYGVVYGNTKEAK